MLTNEQVKTHPHPLLYAFNLQQQMQKFREYIEAMEIEYNQIIIHCNQKEIKEQDGFSIRSRMTTRRSVVPELFREKFPEENQELVAKYAAGIRSDLDTLVETRLLPKISIEDAKKYVGDNKLTEACIVNTSTRYEIVKENE